MVLPVVQGIIQRRLLINYRVHPVALEDILPAPFRPKLVDGKGIAGICLIRLAEVRPQLVPAFLGLHSENAAHRIAVEWDEDGKVCEGVYIPRRDTSSALNTFLGGRFFPGVHNHAHFTVHEENDTYQIAVQSSDGVTQLSVSGKVVTELPAGSIFGTLATASAFFERGAIGYSVTAHPDTFDGLELRTAGWKVEPLAVEQVTSSFFDDKSRFPKGTVEFDCALLMRDIQHEWHARPPICAPSLAASET